MYGVRVFGCYVVMSLCRYAVMPSCRYIYVVCDDVLSFRSVCVVGVMSSCRSFVFSFFLSCGRSIVLPVCMFAMIM